MAEIWYLMPDGQAKHPSGIIKKVSDIKDQIESNPPRIELVAFEGSELEQEQKANELNLEKTLIKKQIEQFWKEQKLADFEYNGQTFPFYEGIETNILGKIQMGQLYEAMNGPGTFKTEWTKKDYSKTEFNLAQVWQFGIIVAEQVERAKSNEIQHLINLQNLNDLAEIKGYNFREFIN